MVQMQHNLSAEFYYCIRMARNSPSGIVAVPIAPRLMTLSMSRQKKTAQAVRTFAD
jgi:hypothetical protein